MIINYLAIGFFWSLLAIKRQQEIYPTGPIWKVWACWALNFLGWPFGMIVALIHKVSK